jgi:hypothetical protein
MKNSLAHSAALQMAFGKFPALDCRVLYSRKYMLSYNYIPAGI